MCVQRGVNGQRGSKPLSLGGPCNSQLSSSLTLSDGGNTICQGWAVGGGGGKPCLKFFSGTSWACCTPRKKRASELGTRHTREGCRLSGAIWTYFLTQCSQPEPLLVALSHPVLGPPYFPEDFRYPGWKYASALLETTDMDTVLRSVSLPMERSTHTWLILVGRMGLAACLWFRIGLNLHSFLSD